MVEDSLQWLGELADRIPEDELRQRIDEIEDRMLHWGRIREALRQLQTARLLAVQAAGGQLRAERPAEDRPVEDEHVTSNGRPSTREAVRILFSEAGGGILHMNEIMESLEARGWLPHGDNPRRLVSAAVSGLVHRNGELQGTGIRGAYRAVPGKLDSPVSTQTGESEETVSTRLFTGSADGEAES